MTSLDQLTSSTSESTARWQRDLRELFLHAKDRFPDVVWNVRDEPQPITTTALFGGAAGIGAGGPKSDALVNEEEVWGHKAMVYARAPPSFQTRYFQFKTAIRTQQYDEDDEDGEINQSELDLGSSLGLSLNVNGFDTTPKGSRTPSPYPAPSTMTAGTTIPGIIRLNTSINPALFQNELEYLYTGQGFGEAFEFLFDNNTSSNYGMEPSRRRSILDIDPDEQKQLRIDKLRKDLVFMWRSRLYSDVKIALNATFQTSHGETAAVFSSHRFVLVSRCEYFRDLLIDWPGKPASSSGTTTTEDNILTLTLPSPPFTPPSLHFTLGYIYTGTLLFSHRTYDLSTALAILASSLYLHLNELTNEVRGRLITEMAHGLFYAHLDFAGYEQAMGGGVWAGVKAYSTLTTLSHTGTDHPCLCRQCARRIPRILLFSIAPATKDVLLERGARRALVGLFGDGWCTQEFASLPAEVVRVAIVGLKKRMEGAVGTRRNIIPMLFAARKALARVSKPSGTPKGRLTSSQPDPWTESVKTHLQTVMNIIDHKLADQLEEVFNPGGECSPDWAELMEGGRALPDLGDGRGSVVAPGFDDAEKVEWIIESIGKGLSTKNCVGVYHAVMNTILLPADPNSQRQSHPHPQQQLLAPTSHIYVQLDQLRLDTLNWIKKRWLQVREDGGFMAMTASRKGEDDASDGDENTAVVDEKQVPMWILGEIADHIEVPLPELLIPPTELPTSKKQRALTSGSNATPRSSTHLHVKQRTGSTLRSGLLSSASSATVSIHSTHSVRTPVSKRHEDDGASMRSFASNSTVGRRGVNVMRAGGERPDSKLTPPSPTPPSQSGPGTPRKPTRAVPDLPLDSSSMASSRSSLLHNDDDDGQELDIGETLETPSTPTASGSTGPPATVAATKSPRTPTTLKKQLTPTSTPSGRRSATRVRNTSATSSIASSPSPQQPARPRSAASTRSFTPSVRSTTASTSRKPSSSSIKSPGAKSPPLPSPTSRPRSAMSTASSSARTTTTTSEGTFKTAGTSQRASAASQAKLRPRTNSTVSVGSTLSTRSTTKSVSSSVSTSASRSRTASSGKGSVPKVPAVPSTSPASARSSRVTPSSSSSASIASTSSSKPPVIKLQARARAEALAEAHKNDPSYAAHTPSIIRSNDSSASLKSNVVKRKGSGDTIKGVKSSPSSSSVRSKATAASSPSNPIRAAPIDPNSTPESLGLGSTLQIGIPCIISSKRKRFRAYARYIGNVEGEEGPWVGVEVPAASSSDAYDADDKENLSASHMKEREAIKDKERERQWNDGTWGGIRYFEISQASVYSHPGGASGSSMGDSEYGFDDYSRASRRRRADNNPSSFRFHLDSAKSQLKRGADPSLTVGRGSKKLRSTSPATSETGAPSASGYWASRGLFVRPQQVLYVVDAIDEDL